MDYYGKIIFELESLQNKETADNLQRFFKTKKGEYGEGDKFLGIKVPVIKKVAKEYYKNIELSEIEKLIKNEYHEIRMCALFLLIFKYRKSNEFYKNQILNLIFDNLKYINNWYLVDTIAPNVIGEHLLNKDKSILYNFAKSDNLWIKRISIVSTLQFIKNNIFEDTLKIIEYFLKNEYLVEGKDLNKHDLIQKASGWMLREIGKRDYQIEFDFLKKHYKNMPRTMLRYAIEKFDKEVRIKFLKGNI